MKLKDLIEQYGEYEVYPDSPKHIENAFKDLDSKDDGTLCLCVKKPKPKSVWELKEGDRYFAVYLTGEIGDIKFSDCQNDCCVIANGNAFLTEEDAKKDVERRRVEALLLKHGGRRWFKDGVANWFIGLAEEEDRLIWFIDNRPIQGVIYFDAEEQAEKAIEEIGADRIKNALFEVR